MEDNKNLPNYVTDKNRGIEIKTAKADPNNPGTFTVSEEEAARLRAMAMSNNGSEMSPEMKAAMGMVDGGDYDQKIPKNVHNQICYDEARRNNEEYRKEANVFTDSVIHDNATKEILDEAEATTNLSNFDFGDISEYLTKLESLSFLEAVSYKKKIDSEIARWKSCKSMLKAISDLKLDDTTNRELMKINAMEDYKFTQSIDDFETHYEENLDKLNQISNKLVEMVNAHKHEMDSTKFLTDEMIHLMKGKIAKLDITDINYEYNRSRMQTVVDAFENRCDLSYLQRKFEIYLQTNKKDIKRSFKEDIPYLNNGRHTKVINDLIRFFNEDITHALYVNLNDAFDDIYATYLMMGFIAKIMNTEKKTSQDVWAKVFALNLSDIENDIFDIDTDTEFVYVNEIRMAFYPMMQDILTILRKNNHNLDAHSAFGGLRKTSNENLQPN